MFVIKVGTWQLGNLATKHLGSYSIFNILSDFVAFLRLDFISDCCWKIKIDYPEIADVFKQHRYIFGEYIKEPGIVRGKPHYTSTFESGKYGIWHNEDGRLIIGCNSEKGEKAGFAYNDNHENYDCPYRPAFDWFYVDFNGEWDEAGLGLTILCTT